MTQSTDTSAAAITTYLTGRSSIDPAFATLAGAYDGWQDLAQQRLQAKFVEFLELLTIEQLADVASGRVDIAGIAQQIAQK